MHELRRWSKSGIVLVAACVAFLGIAHSRVIAADDSVSGATLRVGIQEGDLRGSDNRVLQAAVDYLSGLGGGTLYIGPGRYTMRNALSLRDNISIVGVPGQTILAACDGFSSALAADGDCNRRELPWLN